MLTHETAMALLREDPEKHLETLAHLYATGTKCPEPDILLLQITLKEAYEKIKSDNVHLYDIVRDAQEALQEQLDKYREWSEVAENEKIGITITKEGIGDPEIPIYQVEVRSKEMEGLWRETFSSEEHLQIFLQGLRAAFTFTEVGYISTPEIP